MSYIQLYLPHITEFRSKLKLSEKDVGSHILQLFDITIHLNILSSHVLKYKKDAHSMHRMQILIGKRKKILKYCLKNFKEKTEEILKFFKKK